MSEKHPGCGAYYQENGRDPSYIPVCMGGAAVEGAFEIIIGCNNPNECKPRMRHVQGSDPFLQISNNRVMGVLETVHDTTSSFSQAISIRHRGA